MDKLKVSAEMFEGIFVILEWFITESLKYAHITGWSLEDTQRKMINNLRVEVEMRDRNVKKSDEIKAHLIELYGTIDELRNLAKLDSDVQ